MNTDDFRDRLHHLRAIPLESVLAATGAQRDPLDRAKWHTALGAISVTGMKFMNWNQGRGGGGAIDLAMHLNGLDFKAAVDWLRRHFAVPDFSEPPPSARSLTLPLPDRSKLPTVMQYLVDHRGIPPSLIDSLVESGRLYADTRANAVFLLLGKENRPVGAELRGTGSARWRGMAAGSQKDLGYFSIGVQDPTMIVFVYRVNRYPPTRLEADRCCKVAVGRGGAEVRRKSASTVWRALGGNDPFGLCRGFLPGTSSWRRDSRFP